MKFLLVLIFAFFISLSVNSQTTLPVNYQAAIRDNQGQLIVNEPVDIRFSIIQGNSTNTPIYTEEHATTTSDFGLVQLKLGTGQVLGGDFSQIDWSQIPYFIKIQLNSGNGQGFTDLGTSQLISVPYANYALNVSYDDTSRSNEIQVIGLNGNDLSLSKGGGVIDLSQFLDNTDNQSLSLSGNQVSILGGNSITLPTDQVFDGDSSVFNELQAISFVNDTLTLSNGGKVYLGAYNNSQAIFFNAQEIVSLKSKQQSDSLLLFNLIQSNSNSIQGLNNQLLIINQKVSADSLLFQNQLNTHIAQDQDTDSLNELQFLSRIKDTIFIENGNFIRLPDTLAKGSNIGEMLFWDGIKWSEIPTGNPGQFLQLNHNLEPNWAGVQFPVIILDSAKVLSFNKIKFYSRLLSNGGDSILTYGICWDTLPNPDLSNNLLITNFLNDTIKGLTSSTSYYIRAFATNSAGTGYSNTFSFLTPTIPYNIGQQGPAGGIVFYDKGNYQNGWRYLEAAPYNWNSLGVDSFANWGCYNSPVSGALNSGIGFGLQNTIQIASGCWQQNFAAKVCLNLSLNGFNDWFLPSKDELNLLYQNLQSQGLSSFFNLSYWSSTKGSSIASAWMQNFNNGVQVQSNRNFNHRIRPIRRF